MPVSKEKIRIKAGQWVYFPLARGRLKARVLEDQGLVGYDRERYFLVLVPGGDDMVEYTRVIAESRLTPA